MKLKISHRPEAFFDLFTESAENLRTGAELLQDLIVDYRDVELKAQRVADRTTATRSRTRSSVG